MERKRDYDVKKGLKAGFWSMIVLFVLLIIANLLATFGAFFAYVGIVAQILLYLAAVFVFVNSIMYLAPEKGFAIIALVVSSMFFIMLIMLLFVLIVGASGTGL